MVLCTPSFPVIKDLRGVCAGSFDNEEKNKEDDHWIQLLVVGFWFAKHRRAVEDNIMMNEMY
jgi:hypothetical protein